MATVVKKIGSAPSGRDYSTITLWEADLDLGTIYASGDGAVGELYNDSNFNESFTLNGGATIGLASKWLYPTNGHAHSGAIGTGVRIVCSTGRNWLLNTTNITVEDIEFNCNGFGNSAVATQLQVGSGSTSVAPALLNRLIFHDCAFTIATSASRQFVGLITGYATLQNSILYNLLATNTSTGIVFGLIADTSTANQRFFNTTIHGVTRNGGSGAVYGVQTGTSNHCRNVISTGAGGTTSSATKRAIYHPGTGTKTHNLSDDAGSTNQTSSITFAVVADLYISTVGGAEDLRLKAGAPAIDVGIALGIANFIYQDIERQDRDALGGVTWDIGADEWVSTGPAAYTLDALSTSLVLAVQPVSLERALTNGLPAPLVYWPFNEGAGTTIADASGNGHVATLVEGVWETTTPKFGAAALRNDSELLGTSFTAIPLGTLHTVSWWMDDYDGVSNGDVLNAPGGHYIYFNATILLYIVAGSDCFWDGLVATGSHHWAVVREGLSVTAYRDGVSLGTKTLDGANAPFAPTRVSYYFGGVLDELRIYDAALNAAQVGLLYALNPNSILDALSNSLTISGQSVELDYVPAAVGYSLDALPASLAITGQAVNLDYVPVLAAYSLDVLSASLTISGLAVSLEARRTLDVLPGALLITGQAVSLDYVGAATLPNPIAYWPFNEGSGPVAYDASGNSRTVALGQSTWNSALAKFGGFALQTALTGSGVGASVAQFSIGTVHTMSWWMNGHPYGNSGNIFNNEQIGPPYNLVYFNGSDLTYVVNTGNIAFYGLGDKTGSHHWAIVRNNTSVSFYKDGVLGGSMTISGGVNTPFIVNDLFKSFTGVIDDLRIYNQALSDEQIEALYNFVPLVHTSLDVLPGSLMLSGKSVGLELARSLDVVPAALSLQGQTVSLDIQRAINVLSTSLLITGQTVSLDWSGEPPYKVLDVLPAQLSLTGLAVSLELGYRLDVVTGGLVLSGKAVSLERGLVLDVLPNGLTITPTAVGLDRRYVFNVDPAALLLEGAAVGLFFRRSEIGWDTALHPPLDACRKSLVSELHPSGDPHPFESEALQPEVKGGLQTLSDATHPKANVAQPFPLKRKDC